MTILSKDLLFSRPRTSLVACREHPVLSVDPWLMLSWSTKPQKCSSRSSSRVFSINQVYLPLGLIKQLKFAPHWPFKMITCREAFDWFSLLLLNLQQSYFLFLNNSILLLKAFALFYDLLLQEYFLLYSMHFSAGPLCRIQCYSTRRSVWSLCEFAFRSCFQRPTWFLPPKRSALMYITSYKIF